MNPRRFQEIFLESLKGPLPDLLDLRTEAVFSFSMDQSLIQDSFRYRTRHLGLKAAILLIDERGELHRGRLEELRQFLSQTPFILAPNREGDSLIYAHLRKCLQLLEENKEIWMAIRKFSPPLCHKKAEGIVRETLWPENLRMIQMVHVRKAALAAWFTLLRQTTGSCFATAPAILIQRNNPMQFFKDLYDLLNMGQLKRIIGGKEYAVPLSLSSGVGDLQRVAPSLETSPGLRVALEAGGLAMTAAIERKIKEQNPQTAEKVLKVLLLENMGLTEEDLQEEEYLSRIQMAPLLARQTGIYYQKPSERGQKISEWKKKFANACTAFKAVTECALLRSWEYTIASFCDVKTDFARWNLYIGLGIHPDQQEGIGAFLYEQIDMHLQKCNREVEKLSSECEQELGAMQALETMIRSSVSEARRNQLKAEWTTHSLTLNSLLEMRNRAVSKAESLAGFFSSLIGQYDQKLQEYFQELFDPALLGEEGHLYDDSPAGFRLVYKHGRADASQWTVIYSGAQYIDCLRDFFSNIENALIIPPQIEREVVSEITTALIQWIQNPSFLISAQRRSQEMGRKSPWDYISGGTLQTLLMAYYGRDQPFTQLVITPHSEEELLYFLTHVKRGNPLLMHSPTHAFIFDPKLFPEIIEFDRQVTQRWDERMQEHLADRISQRLPEEEKALFIHLFRQKSKAETNGEVRGNLIEALSPRIKNKIAIVDAVLYEQTPLFSQLQAKEAIGKILLHLGVSKEIENLEGSFFGSYDVYQIAKAYILKTMGAFSAIDWDHEITKAMRHLGLGPPSSFLFADTNWSAWFLGFVIHPTTGHLQLWRLNRNATQGFPMLDWKEWLNEKNSMPWVLLSEFKEYAEGFL